MKLQEKTFKNLKYCLWLPENFNAKKKYPVIFFTHGAGSRGNDLNKLEQNHPVLQRILRYAEEAVICAPQCAKDTWFDVFESLIALTEFIHGRAYADKKRNRREHGRICHDTVDAEQTAIVYGRNNLLRRRNVLECRQAERNSVTVISRRKGYNGISGRKPTYGGKNNRKRRNGYADGVPRLRPRLLEQSV